MMHMVSDDISRAKKYIDNGQVKRAERVLNHFLKQNPTSEAALLLLAYCVTSNNQKTLYLRRVLEINPRNSSAIQDLKRLSSFQGSDNNLVMADEKDSKKTKRAKKVEPTFEPKKEKLKSGRRKSKKEEAATEFVEAAKNTSKVEKPRKKKETKPKEKETVSPPPEYVRKSPEDNFFYGYREGIDVSSRLETGMFGKTIVVDGIRISQYDGPPCFYLKKKQIYLQCNSCTFFSPHNCLLRYDEFLLDDIRRFTEIREERAEAIEKRRRIITRTIQKELKAHGRPLHYSVIAKIIMSRYPKFRLNARGIFHYLLRHPELFEKVDSGVYRAK